MDLKIETNYIPTEEPTNWSDIEGLNKPENNATRNQIFAQNDAPTADYKEGDLWFDTDDNNTTYRANDSLQWVSVKDGSIANKITTFAQASIPTSLAIGDLWIDTDDKNKLYRAASVGANEIKAGEWVAVRDTDIAQALADAATAIGDAADAQSTADGKVVTFYQATAPTAEATGDLWIDTDDDRLYRWSGSLWVEIQDADIASAISAAGTAQSTADGKVVTFYQDNVPTSTAAGDLWVDTNDNNKLYRAIIAGANEIKAGEWVSVKDGTIITTFTQASVPTALAAGDLWFDSDDSYKPYRATNAGDDEVKVGEWVAINFADIGATVGATAGTDLKDSSAVVLADREVKNIGNMTAGETIAGATTPVPVYLNSSDNKVYKCDGNVSTALQCIGFAISTGNANDSIKIQFIGIVGGFSSLTVGSIYYLSDTAGEISATSGTYKIQVGISTSATEIFIYLEDVGTQFGITISDNLKASANTERTQISTSWTKKKEIKVLLAGSLRVKFDLKSVAGGWIDGRIYKNGVQIGTTHSINNTSYTTYTEDFSGIAINDLIQIYLLGDGGSGAATRNFRLYWDIIPINDYIINTD